MNQTFDSHIQPKLWKFKLSEIKQVAQNTFEVLFDTAGLNFYFVAGQYVRITIPDLPADTVRGNTRDFTISSSPNKKDKVSITFRASDSEFKKVLLAAKKGFEVEVQGPLGVFVLPEDHLIPIVFIAGGVGITPFISMIRFVIENNQNRNIQLVYANSNPEKAVYLKELRDIATKHDNFKLFEYYRRISPELLKDKVSYNQSNLWYLCGLPEMVQVLSTSLPTSLGIPDENIRTEEYIGYDKKNTNYKVFSSIKNSKYKDADEKLIKSGLLEPLLESVGQAALVAITDTQGSILYINDKFIEVSKYNKEELIGQNHRILKSGFHPPEFYIELWETISSKRTWRGEIKNRAKDGSFYWVDTTITPLLDEKGNIDRYVAVRFLITDKKNLEKQRTLTLDLLEEIREEKDKINTILQSIGDGVFVVDKDYKIILINSIAAKISGYSADEATGKPYQEVLKFIYESSGKVNDKFVKQAIEENKITAMANHTLLIRKDGTKVSVADSAAPLIDESGEVKGCVVVFRDTTAEREVQQRQESLTNRLELATKAGKIGVWDWDVVKNELVWDDMMYKLYGIKKEDFSGAYEAWQNGLHPDDKKRGDEEIKLALEGKKAFDTSFRVIWPDKSVHDIRAFGFVQRDEKRRPIKMTGVNWEITQEKQLERIKDEFLSVASHQLRTPLGSMRWNMEMLLGGDVGELNPEAKKTVEQIYESNKRMITLVNDLLNVSRIDQDRVADNPKLTDIVDIIQEAVVEMEPLAKEQSVIIKLEVKNDYFPRITLDPKRFREVVQNLLSNAVKYNKPQGTVDVDVQKLNGYVEVKITDTGMGIPKKDQNRLFSKFFRAENAILAQTEGSGLGLFVVKSYIEAWGGKVSFESEEGKGTTFIITLPIKTKSGNLSKNLADQPHQIKNA